MGWVYVMHKLLKIIVKGYLRNAFWRIYGRTLSNAPIPNVTKSVIFICKGNICRSPFAEHIARMLTKSGKSENIKFDSAGLIVSKSISSPKNAIIAAERFGINLSPHKSKEINIEMINTYDMIIAMETWQFHSLRKRFYTYKNNLFLLPLFDNFVSSDNAGFYKYNIKDPYGKDLDEFNDCFERIERCVEGLFKQFENS